jgi:hypothetical protein
METHDRMYACIRAVTLLFVKEGLGIGECLAFVKLGENECIVVPSVNKPLLLLNILV